jgi:hypothetical protein
VKTSDRRAARAKNFMDDNNTYDGAAKGWLRQIWVRNARIGSCQSPQLLVFDQGYHGYHGCMPFIRVIRG